MAVAGVAARGVKNMALQLATLHVQLFEDLRKYSHVLWQTGQRGLSWGSSYRLRRAFISSPCRHGLSTATHVLHTTVPDTLGLAFRYQVCQAATPSQETNAPDTTGHRLLVGQNMPPSFGIGRARHQTGNLNPARHASR